MEQNLLIEKEENYFSCKEAKAIIRKYLPLEEFDSLHFNKHQFIYHEGNPSDGFYIIISGKAKVCKKSNGKEQILDIATENDYLGYECLMTYPKYCTSSIALTDTETMFVSKDIFNYLIQANPELSNAFAELLCASLRRKDKKLTDISYEPVRGRLADALLELEMKFNGKSDGTIILTRNELASYIGSVRETTTRLLSEFREGKLVETGIDGIRVINRNKLISVSNLYR